MVWRRYSYLLIVFIVIPALGCGEEAYDLAPVSGVVLFNGEPLNRGVVKFEPIEGGDAINPGPESKGITDSEGRFVLKTPGDAVGAVVGRHRVKIYSRNPETPAQDVDSQPIVELIPARYNLRTQLEYVVPPEGTDEANFNLNSDER